MPKSKKQKKLNRDFIVFQLNAVNFHFHRKNKKPDEKDERDGRQPSLRSSTNSFFWTIDFRLKMVDVQFSAKSKDDPRTLDKMQFYSLDERILVRLVLFSLCKNQTHNHKKGRRRFFTIIQLDLPFSTVYLFNFIFYLKKHSPKFHPFLVRPNHFIDIDQTKRKNTKTSLIYDLIKNVYLKVAYRSFNGPTKN